MNRDAIRDEPRWSSEPPAVPGWYWCRGPGQEPWPEYWSPPHPTRPPAEPGQEWCTAPLTPPPAAPRLPEVPAEFPVAVTPAGDLIPVMASRSLTRGGRTPD
jgi:hypothetical protein